MINFLNSPEFNVLIDDVVLDWFCLINTKGVGPKTFWALMRAYKTAKESLKHVSNPFPRNTAEKILRSVDCNIILANENTFPKGLKRSCFCPPILYYRGNKSILEKKKIAIIGARNASLSGMSIAKNLASKLSDKFAIISGLAKGIDTNAHIGSLEIPEDEAAIAVLPTGINKVYPKENKDLCEKIAKHGLLLTEVTPCSGPDLGMFQARNRIVSLLADGMIIIEAAAKSGTLATAKAALDVGCEVMVVPGSPVDPRSFGSNLLIKNGATLIQNHLDVLDVLQFDENFERPEIPDQTITTIDDEKNTNSLKDRVLSLLSTKAVSLDEIAYHTNLSIPKLLCIISELEISGKIVKHATNEVSLA
ncbi:MAG: DNA-protecting protein DprA [Holosporales bacterium]|nr:DNA-protecting protein DprA [Holosporales bacterium]